MSYVDRADWHYLGQGFPEGGPQESAATHIGMYLAWVINNNLIGEFHLEESQSSIEEVKKRKITGRTFLINECDSKLSAQDLNDEALDFTDYYYGQGGNVQQYLYDYAEMFIHEPMTFYDVEDTWENYEKIREVIDERYNSWKKIRKIYDRLKA